MDLDAEETVHNIHEKASSLKEHDVASEELGQAEKVEQELRDELAENDGWVKILGNDQLMKKVVSKDVGTKENGYEIFLDFYFRS